MGMKSTRGVGKYRNGNKPHHAEAIRDAKQNSPGGHKMIVDYV